MKKGLTILVIFLVVVVLAFIGYNFANTYAQKKAKAEVEKILKKAHLDKDVTYQSLKADIFSKSIELDNVNWNIEKRGEQVGQLNIKKTVFSGNPKKDVKAKFFEVALINPNLETLKTPKNEPVLTIEKGSFSLKREDGETESSFSAKDILINKKIFDIKNDQQLKTVLFNVLNLDKPIEVKIKTYANENKNTFAIKQYKVEWESNFEANYALKLKNIDLNGLRNASKELNSQNPNPLAILNYLSKVYEIKPIKLKFEIEDKGLVERLEDFIAKENKTTKEDLLKQLAMYIKTTPFKDYLDPIMGFAKGENNELKIEIYNPEALTVGDIIQRMQNEPIYSILKINISN